MGILDNARIVEVTDGNALDYYRALGRSAVGEAVVRHPRRGPMSFAMVDDCDWRSLPLEGYVADAIVAPFLSVK